ncbi:MAG: potassium transporter [Hyphomicrobiales bacterium]|nr:potassium transporter [Hyphomicrobiales bacterium]
MTVGWPVFFAATLCAFLLLNAFFALLYMAGQASVANAPGDFAHYFYFSIETLTTVGYGDMHPQSDYGHIVASVELFLGVLYSAVVTGLFFYRFSRPTARVLFADTAVIAMHDGVRSLMVRAANQRLNFITNATANFWWSRTEVTAEGRIFRRFYQLRLRSPQSPNFVMSWTMIHPIDATSPLYGLTAEQFEEIEATLVVAIEGHDETSVQTVRTRKLYLARDIRESENYVDILENGEDGRPRLNYLKFHQTEPENSVAHDD